MAFSVSSFGRIQGYYWELNHLRNAQMILFNYHYYALDLGRETVLPPYSLHDRTRPSLLIYAGGLDLKGDRNWPGNINPIEIFEK
jgi:hypothetical protein